MDSRAILVPGTVLVDIYADSGDRFLGGAEFNFAYHVHHLLGGLDFVARVGQDENGTFLLDELTRRGFPTRHIQIDMQKPTKTVTVTRNEKGEPAYRIPDHVASEYLEMPSLSIQQIAEYDLVYFGTTLQHGDLSRGTVRQLLKHTQGIRFCDLNLRPPKYTPEVVEYSLWNCDFLKLNHEELNVVATMFDIRGEKAEDCMAELAERFDISGMCVTQAEKGSVLYRNQRFWYKTLEPMTVVDTVGAGDAFSACLVMGLLQRWDSQSMLDRASELAGAICQMRGAVPTEKAFYAGFLSGWEP